MRYLLVLAALLFAPHALAQTYAVDKGSFLLGGTFSFTSTGGDTPSSFGGPDDDRFTEFSISPEFAYFVTPGLALGAKLSYSKFSQRNFSFDSIGLGPRVAYYFGDAAKKTYPFVAGSALYTRADGDVTGFGGELAGGFSHMIARNVGLTGEAFYALSRLSGVTFPGEDEDFNSNTFGIRGGVTAFIF